jgi:hypothetical protein
MNVENRVFTFEEGLWNIRGRYEKACEEDEELVWSKVDDEYVTHILIVSLSLYIFSFYDVFSRTHLATSSLPSLLRLHLQPLYLRLMLVRLPIFNISSLWRFSISILSSLTAVRKV